MDKTVWLEDIHVDVAGEGIQVLCCTGAGRHLTPANRWGQAYSLDIVVFHSERAKVSPESHMGKWGDGAVWIIATGR
jgi:hypothetical protein